jgi:hypothetical protein
MTETATIFVRFTFAGFHRWAGAPPQRSYLADRHRHLFHVEVRMQVGHDDREVEFHDVIDRARAIFEYELSTNGNFGCHSCEMLARELGGRLARLYQRHITTIVSEDGECGAQVEASP